MSCKQGELISAEYSEKILSPCYIKPEQTNGWPPWTARDVASKQLLIVLLRKGQARFAMHTTSKYAVGKRTALTSSSSSSDSSLAAALVSSLAALPVSAAGAAEANASGFSSISLTYAGSWHVHWLSADKCHPKCDCIEGSKGRGPATAVGATAHLVKLRERVALDVDTQGQHVLETCAKMCIDSVKLLQIHFRTQQMLA